MAELMLKIGEGSGYADGDVLHAFNARRIKCVHAQHVCHIRQAPRGDGSLIQVNSLAHAWFEATHQYRFQRVGPVEIKRTTIATGEEELLGLTPNDKGEAIDVRLFLFRRKKHPHHGIFGIPGFEFWYGGAVDVSETKMSVVWNAIETQTPLREANHRRWPATGHEMRSHLFVRVNAMDDTQANELESSDIDRTDSQKPIVLAKRKHVVEWATALGLSESDKVKIRDRSQVFDLREAKQFNVAAIAKIKQRGIR